MSEGGGHVGLCGLALVGVILAGACFSEHAPTAPSGGSSDLCSVPLAPGVGGSTLVVIRSFAYQTSDIRITAGSTVTWVNCEPAGTSPHTSTSDQGLWDSPMMATGEVFTRTFDTPGVFPYHCAPHPFMLGSVTVE
jgi:plastocyanin